MTEPGRTVTRAAHAKINLVLAVAPPRAGDGLHPICSWFAPLDLADEVAVTRLPDGAESRCAITWAADAPMPSPIDWPLERDLTVRAHRALEALAKRRLPVSIAVTKRIPVGGGLGGGSSDAGAALRALIELFGLQPSVRELVALALSLGSDVPYFLLDPPAAAVVESVGESVSPAAALTGTGLVLIFPPFGTPTGAVYRAFDEAPNAPFREAEVRSMAAAGRIEAASLFNDLAAPAERVEPRLAETRLLAARAVRLPVHITGSGSTMFVVCPPECGPDELADRVSAAAPGCRALAARLL